MIAIAAMLSTASAVNAANALTAEQTQSRRWLSLVGGVFCRARLPLHNQAHQLFCQNKERVVATYASLHAVANHGDGHLNAEIKKKAYKEFFVSP
ncbi:MAG: hypothetical protein PHI97_08265 [Desulfobulbus sp.]|nr:hypothetical protein [Desulfobulbus sp.]